MTDDDPLAPILRALARPGAPSSDFDLNKATPPPAGRTLRQAAVLVPLLAGPSGIGVILTKRSSRLRHHPGQIAFPGGKVDPTDASTAAAALRESHEEIGLDPANVMVLGQLPTHETGTGYCITPVLGRVLAAFDPRPEAGEVDEVFTVPLSHLCDPTRYRVQSRIWMGQQRNYFTVPYGPYYIWGATARILRALANRLAP